MRSNTSQDVTRAVRAVEKCGKLSGDGRTEKYPELAACSNCAGDYEERDVVRDVMLSANECGAWLTLVELAAMTRYPAASISAQLRHLKKPQFGNFALKKRMRDKADIYSGTAHGVVWEYRLTRRRRVIQQRERAATTTATKRNSQEQVEVNLIPVAEGTSSAIAAL